MNPPTRGRTSTECTASKWPVNSSQSATTRSTAGATVTWGACICGASFLQPDVTRTKTAAAVQPPAWILSDAESARDNVELMLHDSVTVDDDSWLWHCAGTGSMLPTSNIAQVTQCYRSVTFSSSPGIIRYANR